MSGSQIFGHIPRAVIDVCRRLGDAGHEGYAVGGAVRDAILGRTADDWDVTTSAHPEAVIALFPRTIPTGIAHGTVTVLWGRGQDRQAIEVTTFRSEGTYSDARHPDAVTFGVSLKEDLARRDFTINAIAVDPIARTIIDPFGGAGDIDRRVIRAVGDPAARLSEDGLRILRAIRFVAVLDVALDGATEAAIPGALWALARVSAERIAVETDKLLAGKKARAALDIGARLGVWKVAVPAIDEVASDSEPWRRALDRMDALAPEPGLRLAALLCAGGVDSARATAARLKLKNVRRDHLVAMARHFPRWPAIDSPAAARRLAGRAGRAHAADIAALWHADVVAQADAPAGESTAATLLATAAKAPDPVTVSELAISGGEVMRIANLAPGPAIGQILSLALERVIEDPAQNTPERLRELVAAAAGQLPR